MAPAELEGGLHRLERELQLDEQHACSAEGGLGLSHLVGSHTPVCPCGHGDRILAGLCVDGDERGPRVLVLELDDARRLDPRLAQRIERGRSKSVRTHAADHLHAPPEPGRRQCLVESLPPGTELEPTRPNRLARPRKMLGPHRDIQIQTPHHNNIRHRRTLPPELGDRAPVRFGGWSLGTW